MTKEREKLKFLKNTMTQQTFNPVTCGKRFSSGTETSSINIDPVVEARNENFPSIFGAVKPGIPYGKE